MFNQNEQHYKIILFDGVCNFCNFWVNFIIDRDKKNQFRFAALQSEIAKELLTKFDLPEDDFDSFILISQNKILKKSSAAFEIAKDLNGWLKIFSPLKLLPNSFNDFIYDFVAKNRYKIFGKRDVCRIPTEEDKIKFL
ncbi:MAG TPA: thiol-disulfide oxidoreductase DCC family protein [Ignavibacteriaceae bacterium]|nr:thiol-disulfide oxidoreductase DCC family protein [Ignavibacteriaceae bacterium]